MHRKTLTSLTPSVAAFLALGAFAPASTGGTLAEALSAYRSNEVARAEQMLAVRDYESQRAYSGFAILTAQGLQALASERDIVDQELARLRALIAEAHVEKRKFERLIELEETRTRVAREKREDAELDEMATMRAGRPR